MTSKKESGMNARLIVRGFYEESKVETDLCTAAKDTIRLFFALCSAPKVWMLNQLSPGHLKLKYPRVSYGN